MEKKHAETSARLRRPHVAACRDADGRADGPGLIPSTGNGLSLQIIPLGLYALPQTSNLKGGVDCF